MAQRFNPFQRQAPQNVADLISGLLGDAQQGLVRGQQIRQTREGEQRTQGLEREELDFDKAMQRAELELAQEANQLKADKLSSVPGAKTFQEYFIRQVDSGKMSTEDAIQKMRALSGKDQVKPAKPEKSLTPKNKADLLQGLFKQSVKGGRERRLGETVGRLGELGAFEEETQVPGIGGGSGAFNTIFSQADAVKPPKNPLELRSFLAQNPELAKDSTVGDLSQRLFGLGSKEHRRAFTASPDSSCAHNPFVAEQIFPGGSPQIDNSEVDAIVDKILRDLLGE